MVNDVLEIRELFKIGKKQKEISEKYGVGPDVISRIKNRKSWSHI